MFRIIKPEKGVKSVSDIYAAKLRTNYLKSISENLVQISLTFKIAGYGVEIAGHHLLYATLIAAYLFLAVWGHTIGFNSADNIIILAESLAGGFISLVVISFILGLLNVIYNIPKYIMINK